MNIRRWYRYNLIYNRCITGFNQFLVTMIPTGCRTRATRPPSVTPGATGKPTEPIPGPWLHRVTIWGRKYWSLALFSVKYGLALKCFQVFLCLYFRESTATLLILLTDEETASLTSLTWKHQETHLVGTDTLIINRVHEKSYFNRMASGFIFSE